ncbi:MAG: glutathione S-transferase family protein [Aestuariivirga sp.]
MLNLFVSSIGSCAVASHIALEEAGADYKVTRLDSKAGEQKKPDYLKINPKARVPALATDKGVITETPAILLYIAQTHPMAKLAPTDPFDVAHMQDFNSYLCSTVHPHHAHGIRGYRWSDDPAVIEGLKVNVPANLHECFKLIEDSYLKDPWILGEQFSVADIYLYTLATWLEADKVDINTLPKIKTHRERVAARPATQKVRATYA